MENLKQTTVLVCREKKGFGLALQQHRTDGKDDFDSYAYVITNVRKGSSAEKAGLKEGTIVTHINGKSLYCKSEFQVFAMMNSSNEDVTLSILAPVGFKNLSEASGQQRVSSSGLKTRLGEILRPLFQKKPVGVFTTSTKGYEVM
ncbi:microtubule-associated serine/threonine-protein kinase 3-like isoform X2 [Tachypleus tridentatus]|uniref:microtubule-associated serine/threonine-protein kinase 3-like isoform X2 n=1 Tax=Tachypleus tridentatus TaxID=6853 RepID=UPI003FD19BB1